eukprot:m.180228 g.180228  ORF g.180228 m.180228 type:complete len:982 (+) comp14944_c2_seq1:161-3106(+)
MRRSGRPGLRLAPVLWLVTAQQRGVTGAGWCDNLDRGENCGPEHAHSVEAQTLHLLPGETPRDAVWGSGLIETAIEADVLVAGGGSAGTSAAIAAARNGASVVLVESRPVLGGNSGSEVRTTMAGACGTRSGVGNTNALRLECREGGIVEEYTLDNAVNNPTLVPELFSLELLTMIKAEPNITLFLNTWLVGVNLTDSATGQSGDQTSTARTIASAVLENQGAQRRYVVSAKVFVDTTGDGRLGAEAGAEWIQGREGAAMYNESLARLGFYRTPTDGPDHETEGTSIAYMAEARPAPTPFVPPFWAAEFNQSQFQFRGVAGDRPDGYWWNEISWPYNTITDGENVTNEAIADILGIWDYLKNSGDHPESANMALTWVGTVGCKREGRRFVGQYVQSQNDVMAVDRLCTRKPPWCPPQPTHLPPVQEPELYPDRVSYAGWPFDLHNPKGMRDPSHPPFTSHKMPYMYSTPLRSLVSKDLTNLFFAGRLASFSHVVYGSQRVMKTCATMGQAVGTAAAYAVTHGVDPIDLKDRPDGVWSIQQQLLRDDAYIIGLYNTDPRDHARTAVITATSEWANASAANVANGQSRSVVTPPSDASIGAGGGVPSSQGKNGTNRWISQGLPAAITLALPSPVPIKQIHLIFDTGMHRHFSFSVNFPTNDPTAFWGPQPETVRDYVIEAEVDGVWQVLCNVSGNYQRRRVHALPCPQTPGPPPSPGPPVKPVVAPGSVSATFCNTSAPSQRWSIVPAAGSSSEAGGSAATKAKTAAGAGLASIRSSDGELCLGFSPNTSAYGGLGNSVVALPCGSDPTLWNWTSTAAGRVLRLGAPHLSCSGYPGASTPCECAHPVACSACHGTDEYTPPTSVELWDCGSPASHMLWSGLQVDDAESSTPGVLLMTGGLCLEGPAASEPAQESTLGSPSVYPRRRQRVQPKTPDDLEAEAAPVPPMSKLRVTVTATNGVADARINEIRLYDADGVSPFPARG